jgi:uncharacterized membrane protein
MAEKNSFIVVRYPKKDTAEAALKAVQGLAKEKVVKLNDAVALTKDEKGKIHMHQTKDDTAGKGFVKGGVIGLVFAILFGGPAWIVAGAAAGAGFAAFDRGIKNKLLKELGENMTPEQSALALLIEEADWAKVKERMSAQNFHGEIVVKELVGEHLTEVEKLAQNAKAVEQVPPSVELKAEEPQPQ